MKEFVLERLGKEMIDDPQIQTGMIIQSHSLGHFGPQHIFNDLFNKGFYWKTMLKDIHKVVARCTACRRFSVIHEGYHPLQPLTGDRPMRTVAIDTAGPLPTSKEGHNYIRGHRSFHTFHLSRTTHLEIGKRCVNGITVYVLAIWLS